MGNITHTVGGSSNLVSFRSAARVPIDSLKVYFNPVQDLHGYSNPWPAGGGVNVWSPTTYVDHTGSNNRLTWDGEKYSMTWVNGAVAATTKNVKTYPAGSYVIKTFGISGKSSNVRYEIRSVSTGDLLVMGGPTKTFTASADFYVNVFGVYNDTGTAEFYIEMVSGSVEPTTYTPYSNICPITGWNSADIYETGKNLWGGTQLRDDILAKVEGATADNTAKTVTYAANKVSQVVLFTGFKVNTRYTIFLSGDNTSSTIKSPNLIVHYSDGTMESIGNFVDGVKIHTTHSLKSVVDIRGIWYTSTTILNYERCGVFEGILTENDFVPYEGNKIPVMLSSSKNLYEMIWPYANNPLVSPFGITYTYNNGIVSLSGRNQFPIEYNLELTKRTFKPGHYILSGCPANGSQSTYSLAIMNRTKSIYLAEEDTGNGALFTLDEESVISIVIRVGANINVDGLVFKPMIRYSSISDSTFEPYGTVYGGYIDPVRGVIVPLWRCFKLTSDIEMDYASTTRRIRFYATEENLGVASYGGVMISNQLKWVESLSTDDWTFTQTYNYTTNQYRVQIRVPSSITSVDAFKAYIAEHDIYMAYQAYYEAVEYPITPTSLNTVLDQNHVWSTTNGNTEVTYKLHDSLMIQEAKKRVVSNWPDLLTVEDDKTIEFGSSISAPMNDCKLYFEPIQDTYGPPTGKNWYDKSREIENYYIAQNGNRSADNTCAISALIPVTPGQTFTFSAFVPSGNSTGNKRFHGYTIDSKWKQQIDYISAPANATYTKTFTIPNDVYFLAVSHHKNETNAQLELGSSATAYEEYRPIRHIRGRSAIRYYSDSKFNLLDGNKIVYKTGQLFNEAKHIPDNNNNYKYTKTYIPVRPNTKYTLSMYNGTTYNSGYIHIAYHDNQDEVPFKIEKYNGTGTYFTATFTTPSNTKFIRFSIPVNLTELMLVEGPSRITYATYPDDIYDVGFPYSKNMFDMNSVLPNSSVNNAWVYREADSFMYAVYPSTTCNINIFDGTIYSVSDGQYTLSMAEAIDRDIQIYGSTDGETFTLLDNGITAGNTSATFIVNGQSYIKLVCTLNITSSIAYVTFKKLQLEEGSTATAYEPYGCLYGGYFDPIHGKLVEEWEYGDLGDYTWSRLGTFDLVSCMDIAKGAYAGYTAMPHIVIDKTLSVLTANDWGAAGMSPSDSIVTTGSTGGIWIKSPMFSGLTDSQIKEALTGIKFAAKLATPVTHDLTGMGIQVVKGGNTLWTDADSAMVKYWSKLKTSKLWSTIRKQVRDGYAPYIYPLGTEFTVEHSNITGGLVFVVVDHSVVNNENVMTLLMRDVYQDEVYYDYREALFYAVQEIPAGSYYFTALEKPVGPSENGTSFYFTLPSAIPTGGQFYANISYSGSLLENRTAYIYPNASSLTESFTVVISSTAIAGATYLGSTDGVSSDTSKWLMNHIARCVYGSNNYAESDVRQRINSSAAGSMWWQPRNEFDRPYNNSIALPGFLYGMDESFIAAVGTPTITCKTNNAFENSPWTKNTTYTLNDKFFLPSRDEMGCGSEGGIAEGSVWGYFNGTGQSARLKHFIGNDTVTSYMLRSPEVTSAFNARMINSAGNYANGTPCTCKNIAVACVIK